MIKICVVSWLLLFGVVTAGQAQKIIRGIVRVASNKQGLPGVTVLLKGTTIGASTNINGVFQLVIPRDTVTLLFSSIRFISREKKFIVRNDTVELAPVLLKEDCNLDFFYHKYVEISLLSGLRYTPMGGKIKIFYPYLIHAENSQGSLRAEFSYQSGDNNYQRNATLALDNVLVDCDNDLAVTADCQSLRLGEQALSYIRYTAGATYVNRMVNSRFPLYLAVGKLDYTVNGVNVAKTGMEIGIEHPLFIRGGPQLIMAGRVAYWQNYWQFRGGIEVETRRFTVGFNFNKLGQYAETNARLGFKLQRRLRVKKTS